MEKINNVKVTVLMPCLNVGKYIGKCLDSVLNQTMKELEIFCIDAGSTDGTLEILEEYAAKDERITIIHSDVKSYGYQMNLGVAKAQGEYIGIVETDDFVETDMFESLYQNIKGTQADYIKGTAMEFYEVNGMFVRTCPHIPCAALKENEIVEINPSKEPHIFITDNFLWNGIYKTQLLKQIQFRETPGAAYQDIGVLFKIATTAKKAIYINKNVYLYRQNNMTASSYNKKSLMFVDGEYTNIIDNYLDDLGDLWKKICYKKLTWLIIDRFEIMAGSGVYWEESINSMKGIADKMRLALNKQIIGKGDYTNDYWEKLQLFMRNPYELFILESNLLQQEIKYIQSIYDFIGNQEVILFGSGNWGKYLASLLLICFGIKIKAFWDNDESKWNQSINDIKIEKPKKLTVENCVYIITNKQHADSIHHQLINMGVNKKDIMEYHMDIDTRLYRCISIV